jgi:hypothetical protein
MELNFNPIEKVQLSDFMLFSYYLDIDTAFYWFRNYSLFEIWVNFNLFQFDCIRFWLGPSLPSETLKTAARVMAATVRAV